MKPAEITGLSLKCCVVWKKENRIIVCVGLCSSSDAFYPAVGMETAVPPVTAETRETLDIKNKKDLFLHFCVCAFIFCGRLVFMRTGRGNILTEQHFISSSSGRRRFCLTSLVSKYSIRVRGLLLASYSHLGADVTRVLHKQKI